MPEPARRRVAVLISGRGSNAAALIAATHAPDYPATIALVITNRPVAAGLAFAQKAGVATLALDHEAFGRGDDGRAAFDRALTEALVAAEADYVCLAGFMRLLTKPFVDRWRGRLLNIHPSLLPAFKGLDAPAQAIAAGVRVSGCTVHFVSAEMDAGAILGQAAVPVFPDDDADRLAARILVEEHRLYPACLRLLCEGSARLGEDGRVAYSPGARG